MFLELFTSIKLRLNNIKISNYRNFFLSKVLEQVGLNADTNFSSTTVISLSGSSVTAFRLQNELVNFI